VSILATRTQRDCPAATVRDGHPPKSTGGEPWVPNLPYTPSWGFPTELSPQVRQIMAQGGVSGTRTSAGGSGPVGGRLRTTWGAAPPLRGYQERRVIERSPEPSGARVPGRQGSAAPEPGPTSTRPPLLRPAPPRQSPPLRLSTGAPWGAAPLGGPQGSQHGPQLAPLAVRVEDHPVDYGDFELHGEKLSGGFSLIRMDYGEAACLRCPISTGPNRSRAGIHPSSTESVAPRQNRP
jgi:hypothetical protein